DALDLREAERVDLGGIQVERGVGADQAPVRGLAAGQVADPGALRRPRRREDLVGEDGAQLRERGADLARDRAPELPGDALAVRGGPAQRVESLEGLEERPRLVGRRED